MQQTSAKYRVTNYVSDDAAERYLYLIFKSDHFSKANFPRERSLPRTFPHIINQSPFKYADHFAGERGGFIAEFRNFIHDKRMLILFTGDYFKHGSYSGHEFSQISGALKLSGKTVFSTSIIFSRTKCAKRIAGASKRNDRTWLLRTLNKT